MQPRSLSIAQLTLICQLASPYPAALAHAIVASIQARQPAETLVPPLPPRFCTPTEEHPFVFFHLAKTGGTSLKHALYAATSRLKLNSSIECLTASCRAGRLDKRDWSHLVIAGHMSWGHVFSELPFNKRKFGNGTTISCVTIFREPLERLRSCYYFHRQWHQMPFRWKDLSPAQLQDFLMRACSNEPVRFFSGLDSDDLIFRLYQRPGLAAELNAVARENLGKCLILMQEDWHKPITNTLVKMWMPWLDNLAYRQNVTPAKPKTDALSPEQLAVIRTVNAAEFELYEHAKLLYARQVVFAGDPAARAAPCVP